LVAVLKSMAAAKDLRVLIWGIGITGPVLAYWLSKAGVSVTVLERCEQLRKEGQTVDIRHDGVKIMRWMGVEEEQPRLERFPSARRGELHQRVRNRPGRVGHHSLRSLQGQDQIHLWGLHRYTTHGIRYPHCRRGSLLTTRAKAFNEDVRAPIHSLNFWSPSHILRGTQMRTGPAGITFPTDEKEYFINLLKGTSWESDKILKGLRTANDLYVQEIAQTKAPAWLKGRVVLVGDTAYCPSVITGMGTTAAIAGAYILAAEIIKNPSDHWAAFEAYESSLRGWIEKIQKLPPGVPKLLNPQTSWGIKCFLAIMFFISTLFNSRLFALLNRLNPALYLNFTSKTTLNLPDPSLFEPRKDRA
ncbi:uncharacterized protein VP01_1383g12, partial [Puccinia sorghi]